MKSSLAFFLILLTCFEFTSWATSVDEVKMAVELVHNVIDHVDTSTVHNDSQPDINEIHNANSCHDESHGDCHLGHLHNAVVYLPLSIKLVVSLLKKPRIHLQESMSIKDFHSVISRPPIS